VVRQGWWKSDRLFFASGLIPGLSRKPTRKESTVRWKRWISVTPLAMIAVAPVVASVAFAPMAQAADDTDAVTRLSGIINAPPAAATSGDREVAAMQLVHRDSPAAAAAVLAGLKNKTNPFAQTAIAKAVALTPHPGENLIPVLGDLLGSNPVLSEAAASALANYPGDPAALQLLTKFVDISTTPQPMRESAIRAIGQLIDQPAAAYLFNLATQPKQSDAIQSTALAALGEMSGISDYGGDLRLWKQWWDTMRVKNPEQFRAALLETRARQFNLMKQRNRQLAESSRKLLLDDFYVMTPESQPARLMAYLNDPSPEIRSVGIRVVQVYPRLTTGEVRQRLFQLIADSDEQVRSDVVHLLLSLNDPASLHALIAQLGIEKDPKVAQTIAQILGNLNDPNAAPDAAKALIPMLHDSNPENAIAAAKALAGLGGNVRKKDPKLAEDLSNQIRGILKNIDNQPGTNVLRAACVSALAELRDPTSLDTFRACLQPGETVEVRKAALTGLGNLGDARANQIVLDCLGDLDSAIRLEAAHALTTVATPDQDFAIFDHMNNDRDPDVKAALWVAFRALYDKETQGQLEHWAATFDNNPERKIITLEKLGDVLKRARDAPDIAPNDRAREEQAIAYNDQAIAAAMMSVKPTPMVTEATAHLQLALDYWRGPGKGTGGSNENLETLVGQMLDVKLTAEQWGPACTFAAEQITLDPIYQPTVGPRIKDKIDELIKTGNTAAAQKLIDAALAMKPPLDTRYVRMIQSAQTDLKQKPASP
jgi:HEAT repeat protein